MKALAGWEDDTHDIVVQVANEDLRIDFTLPVDEAESLANQILGMVRYVRDVVAVE